MDHKLRQEALNYLEELFNDFPDEKSGEEILNRMEWKIRQHKGELFDAIISALEVWLNGNDYDKAAFAIHLIGRLGAKQYVSDLEKLAKDMNDGKSHLPSYWKSIVQGVLNQMQK
jgi:hypothetical protein